MERAADHVLFYGSLRQGGGAYERLGLGKQLSFVRPARIRGVMYDLGDYPGVVLAGAGYVRGELHRILDPAALAALDDYELYRPSDPRPYDPALDRGSLYIRRTLRLGAASAFIYELNIDPRGRPRVPGGDWLAYRGLAPSRHM